MHGIRLCGIGELRDLLAKAISLGAHATAERLQLELALRAPRMYDVGERERVA